jgi:hypothetical protein
MKSNWNSVSGVYRLCNRSKAHFGAFMGLKSLSLKCLRFWKSAGRGCISKQEQSNQDNLASPGDTPGIPKMRPKAD